MPHLLHAAILCTLALPALAGESPFGYLYTAETTPAHTWEYEQWNTLRTGKSHGRYAGFDVSSEIEAGLTDRLQASLYIHSSYLYMRDVPNPENSSENFPSRHDFGINGASLELMYRLLSPYKDGFGLALSLEPELSARDKHTAEAEIERALESKLILQKNFLDDQLILAANLTLEPQWAQDEGRAVKSLAAEWSLGASYRAIARWSAGLEIRQTMEFPDMNMGHRGDCALFLGPTIHYGGQRFWWTLSASPQVHGQPSSNGLQLAHNERAEFRFKLGIPF